MMIARHAAMEGTGQRALSLLVAPRAVATTRCIAAPSPISRALSSSSPLEQRNVASLEAATATTTVPVGARAPPTEHRSLRGRPSLGGPPVVRGSGFAAHFPLDIGSRRALSSAALLASDGEDVSVIEDGTESYLVAQRKLVAGDVLFGCTTGTLSTVRSRHSLQVTADLNLTVSDDLQLINHGCNPNCQLEVVECSSTAGEDPCLRIVVIAPEIPADEMLTIDYNSFEVEMVNSFDCVCGATNCRGHISGFSKLPASVQEEYLQGHWSMSEVGPGGSGAPPLLTKAVKEWAATRSTPRG